MPRHYRGDPTRPWFFEGNVVRMVERYLNRQGWKTVSVIDPATHQQGVDLALERGGMQLLLEGKGYPGTTYAYGPNAGQVKSTAAPTQARHWFGQGVLGVLLRADLEPTALNALAFPDFQTYRSLFSRTSWALDQLQIGVYFIDEKGGVTEKLSPGPRPRRRQRTGASSTLGVPR